jgi:16S rRNA (guanine527-N7)-methyltransferase
VSPSDSPSAGLAAALAAEAARLGIDVPADSTQRLAAYAASLWRWNERLNLEKFVSRDVGDAVAIAGHLAVGERILDVGTGGGVPGVPLAILRPDLRVELAESVAKKARAVAEILREIGVAIPVHEGAAQALVSARGAGPERFDTLVIRAVAPLEKLLRWFEPIAGSYGRMLVVKGPRWEEEKAEARHRGLAKRVLVRRIAAWPIRGSDNESVLLEIKARSG